MGNLKRTQLGALFNSQLYFMMTKGHTFECINKGSNRGGATEGRVI